MPSGESDCLILLEVSGPSRGTRWELPFGRTTVGRSADSDIAIQAAGVSRRHCVFVRTSEGCTVTDLSSHNGTLVNGTPVSERALVSGDTISIGEATFLFAPEEGAVADPATIGRGSISLSDLAVPSSVRRRHDMKTVLRLTAVLYSFRALRDSTGEGAREELSRNVVALLVEMFGAREAALLAPGQAAAASAVVQGAARARTAVLSGSSEMAAPIIAGGEVVALIYVSAAPDSARFSEAELQLLTAIAVVAATAWENATFISSLQSENQRLREELGVESRILGKSPRIRDLVERIGRAARSNATVLILGESGTGKELVARAIHVNSARAAGPFVAISCAALTASLLESELFGYEKGAFTGAYAQRKGKLEAANGGTLFLDEIGEMPLELQAKLLRVLQERELERVGGTNRVTLDLRVVAATNRNLEDAVAKGRFRADLFYRLNVIALHTPALRERVEDIPLLAGHFVTKFAAACGRRVSGISEAALALLERHTWPGNVRELENAIERAVVLGRSDLIEPEDLPDTLWLGSGAREAVTLYEDALQSARREVVLKAFELCDYDHDAAARRLGLHPNYLHRLIRSLELREVLRRSARGAG
jgi:transcriptional regulator with GAF, ATPase, and Fis domain